MSAQRWVIGILGVGALLGGIALLASRRVAAPPPSDTNLPPLSNEELEELAPDSTAFEPAPESEPYLTVRTREPVPRWSSADDLEALGSEELGAAYLSRATEQHAFEEDLLEAELVGFQIVERS